MEPGSTNTTKQTCGSTVCWSVLRLNCKFMFTCYLPATSFVPTVFSKVFLVKYILHMFPYLSIFCCLFYRFRMVLPYMQHGQPLHPWLTWTLCWLMTPTCPRQTLPPSPSLFWLWWWWCGKCKVEAKNTFNKFIKKKTIFLEQTCFISHRFFLENTVLDKHVRYILTIYPVVIWALTGVYTKNYDAAAPSSNDIFTGEELTKTS